MSNDWPDARQHRWEIRSGPAGDIVPPVPVQSYFAHHTVNDAPRTQLYVEFTTLPRAIETALAEQIRALIETTIAAHNQEPRHE